MHELPSLLRDRADDWCEVTLAELLERAADEIERLRAALQFIERGVSSSVTPEATSAKFRSVARAALGNGVDKK
jgi:hypothetical protein